MFLLIFIIFAPILALLFLPFKDNNRNFFYIASILISVSTIFCSFYCPLGIAFSYLPLSLIVVVDQYSKIFLILVSCTWLISIIYSYDFSRYNFQEKKKRFFVFLNLLLSIAILNACAGNLTTLFIFYVLGIPLTYPLLMLRNNSQSLKASKLFLKQTLMPSFFIFLPAIVITESLIGDVTFKGSGHFAQHNIHPMLGGMLLAMFVVGISKNSVFPFHKWLPGTHPVPAPVSGLIHSVATVKTGSIALIKIAVYIFGLDYIHLVTSGFLTGGWIIYLCGLTALYTAYKAFVSDDLKQRFTYSTVGQLAYIILAILIGTKTGIIAATLHIVTHAVAKSCLFYVAGFYSSVYKTTSVKELSTIMPSTRFMAFVIAICALSITGFPFLAGYYSKDLMLIEEWHAHYYASAIFLLLGSLINILYIIGPVKSAFGKIDPTLSIKKIPLSMLITFIISVALIFGSNFYVSYITLLIE